ncbi:MULTISPECIES: LuxR family transcriptional regulator [unclassified Rhizobium]|uniref:helix-turn-helix transcriptional regulator n=1 Tax=unclassified Rhizobium TaxID=2613769 RepID=UPI0024799D2E|nr:MULTISPECIES: LuxR family transcriptional regulator [unclassified Rhizobium]
MFDALNSGCFALGFDLFTLSCNKPSGRAMILDSTFTTVSSEFLRDYDHLGWYDDDAMAARIVSGDGPFAWNSQHDKFSEVRKQSYVDFLHANSLCSGIMVPLAGRNGTVGMLGLISLRQSLFERELIAAVTIIANAAAARAELLGLVGHVSSDEAQALHTLSERQYEILRWIAEGKSNSSIAVIMGLNERAVRFHVSEILRKLGIATRNQAIGILQASEAAIRPRK